jgi:hypothetical protein
VSREKIEPVVQGGSPPSEIIKGIRTTPGDWRVFCSLAKEAGLSNGAFLGRLCRIWEQDKGDFAPDPETAVLLERIARIGPASASARSFWGNALQVCLKKDLPPNQRDAVKGWLRRLCVEVKP